MRQASDIGRGFERPHPQAAFRRPSRKGCQAHLRTAPCLTAGTNGVQGVHSLWFDSNPQIRNSAPAEPVHRPDSPLASTSPPCGQCASTCRRANRRHADWTPERLRQAGEIGRNASALVEIIPPERAQPEQGFRACVSILRLAKIYGRERSRLHPRQTSDCRKPPSPRHHPMNANGRVRTDPIGEALCLRRLGVGVDLTRRAPRRTAAPS
jgi:hypothetical protein